MRLHQDPAPLAALSNRPRLPSVRGLGAAALLICACGWLSGCGGMAYYDMAGAPAPLMEERPPEGFNTEGYDKINDNPFVAVADDPLSTFSVDVDTASYSNVRRFLNQERLPPADAVRIEELVNYFSYDYPEPQGKDPFSVNTEIGDCPWNPKHQLVHIGLRGKSIEAEALPARNLVFLLDVSGSMNNPDKLPLLKQAMGLLVGELGEKDRVALVVYAGAAGLVLPSTPGDQKDRILDAVQNLQAGGSTAGGEGIELAYAVAREHFIQGGINRVILGTDGDFNVGVSSRGGLERLIEEKRKSGIFLTVLGFGQGNLKDSQMEALADKGNGNYAYIDSIHEARKVLVQEAGATLVTIAKDVKLQVEFNPARVEAFRLIGYENRILAHRDFNDDSKDAGDIGAGHTVTALYEIVPAGSGEIAPMQDALKYQAGAEAPKAGEASSELLTFKLRFKEPDGEQSQLRTFPLEASKKALADTSDNYRFSAAVAAFGMILRDSPHKGGSTFPMVTELASGARGQDVGNYRRGFLELVRKAAQLKDGPRLGQR